eukprot:TRINITY_DN14110_c0_g1_i7.p1 TRINITY_DN14110_c0_g1~~TRINITY_DN14110_c0_g1_i7.p1  ORF type:complete len:245 (+),score=4.80 TRINITY_DN14110_c0_g1_i7:198-932(+)
MRLADSRMSLPTALLLAASAAALIYLITLLLSSVIAVKVQYLQSHVDEAESPIGATGVAEASSASTVTTGVAEASSTLSGTTGVAEASSTGSTTTGLPRLIWRFWDSNPKHTSKDSQREKYTKTWLLLHPEPAWTHRQVNTTQLCELFPGLSILLKGRPRTPRERSDLARLWLLAQFGGVWTDTSTLPVRRMDEWLPPLVRLKATPDVGLKGILRQTLGKAHFPLSLFVSTCFNKKTVAEEYLS